MMWPPCSLLLLDFGRHALAFGFAAQMVLGVASRVVPNFTGKALWSPAARDAAFYALNASMAFRALEVPIGLGVWPQAWNYIAWSGPLGVLAMLLFTMNIMMMVRRRSSAQVLTSPRGLISLVALTKEADMKRMWIATTFVAAVGAAAMLAAQGKKTGSAEQNLPSNITQLTAFGERASWSPDGRQIAFMSKSFGDAFVVDVRTKMVRLLTHYHNPGYLRVQYLPNGDFFLIGARTFTDIRTTRSRDQEMWVLKADGKGQPTPLDHKISEGVAISPKSTKIAWSNTRGQYPDLLQDGESVIYTADIVEKMGRPTLVNKKEIIRARAPECTLEAQDFRRNDSELIYTCYRSPFADVFGIDLNTGTVTTYRKVAGEYNEVEGIFPNGEYALVESSREQIKHNSNYIDIWKLKLEPNSTDYVRMTRWGDYEGYKASNPVVSPDGTTIAFQSARSSDPAGVGYGIFLLRVR